MLELTESEYAPWTIVEATSKSYTRKKVFETVIAALEKSLGPKAPPPTEAFAEFSKDAELRAAMESLTAGRH
jgi:Polyphosphate kinase 2 (PPK2)